MSAIKPISPDEVGQAQFQILPDEVIEVVNSLIAKNFYNGSSTIKQHVIIECLMGRLNITKGEIFNLGYLNFEEAYRAAGWKVIYDKPAYNESYDAFFKFSR